MGIFPPDLMPLTLPDTAPELELDVVCLRTNAERSIVQCVFVRAGGAFGFRYHAWVNFEDAGGGAHHMWYECLPDQNAFIDSAAGAREIAEAHAIASELSLGEWSVVLA